MSKYIVEDTKKITSTRFTAMKAEGKTYCDCPACTKAREILKDLNIDLDEPSAE